MPFLNGRFYMNPAHGCAVESARNAEAASGESEAQHDGLEAHWVTIAGHHVLIQGTQEEQVQHERGRSKGHTRAPKNSRDDVVLIPKGSGKPIANVDINGMWTMRWGPRELQGGGLEPPGNKYSNSKVELAESVNGGPFKPAGSRKGEFSDIISPESRTIVQQFSIDGRRVQVVLGKDAKGNLIKTWDVKVTVRYPNPPAYSPTP